MGKGTPLTDVSRGTGSQRPSPVEEFGVSGLGAQKGAQGEQTPSAAARSEPLGRVWINSSYPIVSAGLARILEDRAQVHLGREVLEDTPPEEMPSLVILDTDGVEGLPEEVRRIEQINSNIAILVFSLHLDMPVAWTALQAGARGFLHAGMQPHQVVRAVELAIKGELVAPRKLLEYLVNEEYVDIDALSIRQREILYLLAEGMSNAQIAQRLYLSESTIKQHLRHAYKLLGVKNRTEAANFIQRAQGSRTPPTFRESPA